MQCIVTAGPTYEPLDEVRRLTNFSTGQLGSELVDFLSAHGHEATLLIGQQATYRGERHARHVETFTTTTNLRDRLRALASETVGAVFHAAAVSDFSFGKVWSGPPHGELRPWLSRARLVGWKYEVHGGRAGVIRLAEHQIPECRPDACVANGPAYGTGFGLVRGGGEFAHLPDTAALFVALEEFMRERQDTQG